MPLDSRATQTTATNSATYLVNSRRRVFATGTSGAACCGASTPATSGRVEARKNLAKSRALMASTVSNVGPPGPRPPRDAPRSFYHLVGERDHRWRHGQAQRRCGLEIDGKLKFGGRLRRKFGRIGPLQDAIDIRSRAPENVRRFWPVRHQSAFLDELPIGIDRGDPVLRRRLNDQLAVDQGIRIRRHHQAASRRRRERGDGAYNLGFVADTARRDLD